MRRPYAQIRRTPNPVVLGRKFCPGCGRWRPVHDFSWNRRTGTFRPPCLCCERTRQRAGRRRHTPEQIKLRREYQRIWAEGQRRRLGIPPRDYRHATVVDHIERVFLDPAPLLEVLTPYLARDNGHGVLFTFEEFAEMAGVADRTLRRLFSGESQHVRLDVADKLAVAMGSALSLLYPS